MSTKRTSSTQRGKRENKTNTKCQNQKESKIDFSKDRENLKRCDYDSVVSNDISYYNKNKSLFDAATNIPMRNVVGYGLERTNPIFPNWTKTNQDYVQSFLDGAVKDYAEPSIMQINYMPGVGMASGYSSAINRCFQNIYSTMYAKTSGSSLNFPQWELGVVTVAVQSIAQNIGFCKRALEFSRFVPAANANFPRLLLQAMRLNAQDVIDNYNDYISDVNNLILDFNSMKFPAFIDVFKRQYSLAHNVYSDEDNVYGQLYVFVPAGYYIFSDIGIKESSTGDYDGVAGAYGVKWPAGDSNLSAIIDLIRTQIECIRSSSDYATILGALLRTFDDKQLLNLDLCENGAIAVPQYDETILMQIANSNRSGYVSNLDCWLANLDKQFSYTGCYVTGNPVTNMISSDYSFNQVNGGANNVGGQHLINFDKVYQGDDLRNALMEATRLVTIGHFDSAQDIYTLEAAGTEIITSVVIYQYSGAGYNNTIVQTPVPPSVFFEMQKGSDGKYTITDEQDTLKFLLQGLPELTKFKYAPRVYVWAIYPTREGNATMPLGKYYGDVNYFTYISDANLRQLHNTALLSIFDVTDSLVPGKPIR